MTKKKESINDTAGVVKETAGKRPRERKAPPPFDVAAIDEMLGEHPTHEHFEDVFKRIDAEDGQDR